MLSEFQFTPIKILSESHLSNSSLMKEAIKNDRFMSATTNDLGQSAYKPGKSKYSYFRLILILLFFAACKVTFISGYDPILENTITNMQHDFNLHFIKLARTIQDTDPGNQHFIKFQEYYDKMNADLYMLKSRTHFLDKKSGVVKKQISNLDSTLHAFERLHKDPGFKDKVSDDRHDIQEAINSSFEAVLKLQAELKPKK